MSSAVTIVWTFVEKAVDGLSNAFRALTHDLLFSFEPPSIFMLPKYPFQIANRWLSAIDNFLNALSSIVPKAALQTALTAFSAPRWTRSRSLSAENAYNLVVLSILVPSISMVDGTLPFGVRLRAYIAKKNGLIKALFHPTFERWFGILLKPFRVTVAKILSIVWSMVASFLNFFFAIAALLIFSTFVERGGEDLLELCFQQSTPRKRRHLSTGELILRREPGGSRP